MSERGIRAFLQDILEASKRIQAYTDGHSYEDFRGDEKTQDAVVRNLEVIGEAFKNMPEDYREKHPQIQWKGMAGMRDRLIHFYFGVNLDIVWNVVKNEIGKVADQFEILLKEEFD